MEIVRVGKIILKNFRSYLSFKEDFSLYNNIVITGKNGVGKTNILEAVSLLSIGGGLRKARFLDIGNLSNDSKKKDWSVFSEIDCAGDVSTVATGYDYSVRGMKKSTGRVLLLNGDKVKNHSDILDFVRVVSLVPWMDRIFQDSSADRRKFFDGFIEQFYRFHNVLLQDYNNLMRQRTKLLKKKSYDKELVFILEKGMAEKAVAIGANRISYVAKINKLLEGNDGLPKVKVVLDGLIESALISASASEVEDMFIEKLFDNRSDFETSFSPNVPGVHRTDFSAINLDKKISVSLSSTGEQKLVVVSLVLQNIELIKLNFDICPLVLIDEAVAHLDSQKKGYFFDLLQKSGCQCFYTGVSKEYFNDVVFDKVKFLELSD